MNKLHNISIGDFGSYEGELCTVSDIIDELTIEVRGFFGRTSIPKYIYKTIFHKLLNIPYVSYEEFSYQKSIYISYYNFKSHKH